MRHLSVLLGIDFNKARWLGLHWYCIKGFILAGKFFTWHLLINLSTANKNHFSNWVSPKQRLGTFNTENVWHENKDGEITCRLLAALREKYWNRVSKRRVGFASFSCSSAGQLDLHPTRSNHVWNRHFLFLNQKPDLTWIEEIIEDGI